MAAPVKIEAWHGGITDDYIDAPPHFAKRLNEVLLNRSRKAVQRSGTDIYNSNAPQIPPGEQRIDSFYYFDSTLFVKSGTKLYLRKDGDATWTTLATTSAKDAFIDSELGARVSWSEWRGHLYATPHPGSTVKAGCHTIKIYRSGATTWACVTAGMPRAQDGTTGGLEVSGGGTENFVSYNVFYRTYTAVVDGNTVTFEDYGKPVFKAWTYEDRAGSEDGTLAWTNAANDSYDDGNIKVRLYRTKNNDVTPLFSSDKAQGATINFTVDDSDLGQAAYFAGGVQFWDPIPKCYYSDIVEGCGFYAAGVDIDSGSFFNTRLWQSHPGNPNGVPAANFVDAPAKITGLSHVGVYPVLFCRSSMYRVEGRFDAFGGGRMALKEISGTEGCISAAAIVRTEFGIFFPSQTGWCFTDGFRVQKLSTHLTETFKALLNKSLMVGTFDSKNRRVYWACEDATLNPTGTAGRNTTMYVLDLNQMEGNVGVFTTLGRGDTLESSALFYDEANDRILMGGYRGHVMKFDSTKTTDLVVNTAIAFATWARYAIAWSYVSPSFSFGSSLVTKYMQRLYIVAKNLNASFSADLTSYRDDSTVSYPMKEVRERKATTTGLHRVWRMFKKGGLRCSYRQIQIDKGWVNLFRSDDYSVADVNSALKTALISTPWPSDGGVDLRGHVVAFADDDYVTEHVIVTHSGPTLTLATAPAGNPQDLAWVVRGYPKGESLELRGVEIEFELEDTTTTAYQAGGDNANGE